MAKSPKKLSIDDPGLSQWTNWFKLQQRWIAAHAATETMTATRPAKKPRKRSP